MKLGIVVVYLCEEEDEPLLDLHLNRIEAHTGAPFVIYGSVNRLAPRLRERLRRHAAVRLCECPETALRGASEHACYLDCLTRIAVEDGASHVVSLHLDSFPIRSGWAEELSNRLSPSCAFATLDRISTACLMFSRDFYLRHRPAFALSEAQRRDAKYRQYLAEHDPVPHSGIGYGFAAYSNGLSWYYLRDRDDGPPSVIGRIYDDMIFHLYGAVRLGERRFENSGVLRSPRYARFADAVAGLARAVLPRRARNYLRARFSAPKYRLLDRPRLRSLSRQVSEAKRQMLEDPDAFFNRVRTGSS
jgi:hypothetical protein